MSCDRRRAVFWVTAPAHCRRAARGLLSRSIRAMLGSGYTRAPYFCEYESAAKQAAEFEGLSPRDCFARYAAQLTDVECEAILLAVAISSEREGWSCAPVEWRHDSPDTEQTNIEKHGDNALTTPGASDRVL